MSEEETKGGAAQVTVQAACSLSVVKWCSYEQSLRDAPKEGIGGMGGFFDHGMRWKDYAEQWTEEGLRYIEAIRSAVLKDGLRITGAEHQSHNVPIFSDGTAGRFSYRAWGDLMAAIWAEAENKDYCYMDFYM